jgi:hypothetical protein
MNVSNLAIGVLAAGLATVASASAATITSTPFSIGYGSTAPNGLWSTSEFPQTLPGGDFLLTVDVAGDGQSRTGITFTNGVPDELGGINNAYSAAAGSFAASLTGTYNGTPGDVAAIPNYHVEVQISQMSFYGSAGGTANLKETTLGHEQSQSAQTLPAAYTFAQFVWDSGSGLTNYSSVGTTQTRTFGIDDSPAGGAFLDGFQASGNIVVTYDAVPEPASLGLMALGGLLLVRRRRQV